MTNFLNVIKHLLPNARAWRLTESKTLRAFFEGLVELPADIKQFADLAWLDIFPETTRELDQWETQFNLRTNATLSEVERRNRLDETWKNQGGQDPRYIQDTLQGQGFDVYVHEWFEPGSEPPVDSVACAISRNPLLYIQREYTGVGTWVTGCGESFMTCGDSRATCGNSSEPAGYPLVNILLTTEKISLTGCGQPYMTCGDSRATCGNFSGYENKRRKYTVPNDVDKWPYFLYIGGEVFPDMVTLPLNRRDEFEELCLKICPAQQWLGMLVDYT